MDASLVLKQDQGITLQGTTLQTLHNTYRLHIASNNLFHGSILVAIHWAWYWYLFWQTTKKYYSNGLKLMDASLVLKQDQTPTLQNVHKYI
jgi:hypothetical protein